MTAFRLKSFHFRREREATWRALEDLVGRAEKRGVRALSPAELERLPSLYFATLSSLSVARSISLDRNVVAYLESLAGRAYFLVYGARTDLLTSIADFFRWRFPAAVRRLALPFAVALLTFIVGAVAGYVLVADNPDWYYSFVGDDLADGRTPTASTEYLRDGLVRDNTSEASALSLFATYLFTHNAKIGLLCFALGFALGVPTIILVAQNGLMFGAFTALYASRGLFVDLWGWLLIHGVTELLAIILCAAAGIALGGAVAFPGVHGRLANLAAKGRLAGEVAVGAVVMFMIAGLLEGLGRQLITDTSLRWLIAMTTALGWGLYFTFVGRTADRGGDR
ncbi:MAG TPA: stage II sporulation protein M [Methylomirabilota bacterium]|nr:stage II sporulation protein M [Methylomirabilota bacterium]